MIRPKIIIGIAGKMGTGKTTAANYLVDKYWFKKISFADKLKETSKYFFDFTSSDFSPSSKNKKYKNYDWTVRQFLINLGGFMRYHDEDYWVKASKLDKELGRVVIDDVRFPNEVRHLKELGAKIIRLNRYPKLNIYGDGLDDPSETSLDDYKDWDYFVEDCSNVSLKDLKDQMDRAMEMFI